MRLTEAELGAALKDNRFALHYQPQYTAEGSSVCAIEALVRLRDPAGVLVEAQLFMPLLEQTELIHPLGRWVFTQACSDAEHWPKMRVAVNVSPVQLQDTKFVESVVAIANKSGVRRGQIELEITEGVYFAEPERAESTLRELRDAGFAIALDDFGTGYSSFDYLRRFPVNTIKIDKSFIDDVTADTPSAAIVRALIGLSRALGLKVVAEGVERHEQQRVLHGFGCDYLQGFLFSKAIPAAALKALHGWPTMR